MEILLFDLCLHIDCGALGFSVATNGKKKRRTHKGYDAQPKHF